jgi:hypothetical protein
LFSLFIPNISLIGAKSLQGASKAEVNAILLGRPVRDAPGLNYFQTDENPQKKGIQECIARKSKANRKGIRKNTIGKGTT